jgi:hypothetical protein
MESEDHIRAQLMGGGADQFNLGAVRPLRHRRPPPPPPPLPLPPARR